MTFELRPIDRARLYVSIVDQIVEGIRTGAYPPGTALPSERALATSLGTSRHSVREAIRVLEHAGLVVVRTGSGTYITETGLSKAAVVRARTELEGDPSPLDVLTARIGIEPVCAAEAARGAHADDVAVIRQAFVLQRSLFDEQGSDSADDDLKLMEADYAFHNAIAHATHNPVLLDMVEQLTELMRKAARQEFQRRVHERHDARERYLQHHELIVRAIERRDTEAASRVMAEHLRSVASDLDEAVR
jgi:GntR family transcriptional repressor for pyruvate dehydrogenase complex